MIIAQTQHLIIREFLPEEESLFLDLLSDERITPYLPKRNRDDNKKIFDTTQADYTQNIRLTRWSIINKTDAAYVGFCLLKSIENEPRLAELGYVIAHQFKGNGFATEVAGALLAYGFNEIKLTEIFAVTSRENIASQRVLLKAGMTKGNDMMRNGEWLSYYKISADEYAL